MPTVPLYSLQSEAAYSNIDVGSTPIINPGCWMGWVGQEAGSGLGQLAQNVEFTSLYNCTEENPGRVDYYGGILDWRFANPIQDLNPGTKSDVVR